MNTAHYLSSLEATMERERRMEQFTLNWKRMGWGGAVHKTARIRKWWGRNRREYLQTVMFLSLITMAAAFGFWGEWILEWMRGVL